MAKVSIPEALQQQPLADTAEIFNSNHDTEHTQTFIERQLDQRIYEEFNFKRSYRIKLLKH